MGCSIKNIFTNRTCVPLLKLVNFRPENLSKIFLPIELTSRMQDNVTITYADLLPLMMRPTCQINLKHNRQFFYDRLYLVYAISGSNSNIMIIPDIIEGWLDIVLAAFPEQHADIEYSSRKARKGLCVA